MSFGVTNIDFRLTSGFVICEYFLKLARATLPGLGMVVLLTVRSLVLCVS